MYFIKCFFNGYICMENITELMKLVYNTLSRDKSQSI